MVAISRECYHSDEGFPPALTTVNTQVSILQSRIRTTLEHLDCRRVLSLSRRIPTLCTAPLLKAAPHTQER
jgi:hypothetical protein